MAKRKRERPSTVLTVGGRRALDEFNLFMGAGMPGFDRLQAVYGSIFKHFAVHSEQERARVLLKAGLRALGPKKLERVRASSCGWSGRAYCAEAEG